MVTAEHLQYFSNLVLLPLQAQPPNPGPGPLPGQLGAFGSTIVGWLKTIAIIAGVIMLVVSGIMVIVGRRNRNQFAQDGLVGSIWVIGGLALVGTAATLVGAIPT